MLPGVGVSEYILIAIAALVVIGPKDLPILMRKAGAFINRLRGMAAEFRASFDEMARQSELEELRKQVEELRSGQLMQPITAEIAPAMTQIETDIRAGVGGDWSAAAIEAAPAVEEPDTQRPPSPARKRKAKATPKASPKATPKATPKAAPKAARPAPTKTAPAKSAPAKPARAKPAPARKASAAARPLANGGKA